MTDIKNGILFKSVCFAGQAEVASVREAANEVDIVFTPTDGNRWEQKAMDLQALKDAFSKGYHTEIEKSANNITIGVW